MYFYLSQTFTLSCPCLHSLGPPAIPPSSAPGKTEAVGGTIAATQPILMDDITWVDPTRQEWQSTAQMMAWCG